MLLALSLAGVAVVGTSAASAQPSATQASHEQQSAAAQAAGVKPAVVPALVTTPTGSFTDQQYFATQDTAFVVPAATPANTWVTVPGMVRTATVLPNTRALLKATFTGEVECDAPVAPANGWCSARIVVITASGGVFELAPASGLDFALDSPGAPGSAEFWEGHAMARVSSSLPAGTYRVEVQVAKAFNAALTYRVDDAFLEVDRVRP